MADKKEDFEPTIVDVAREGGDLQTLLATQLTMEQAVETAKKEVARREKELADHKEKVRKQEQKLQMISKRYWRLS